MNIYLLILLKLVYWGFLRSQYATFVFGGDDKDTVIGNVGKTMYYTLLETGPFLITAFLNPIWVFHGTVMAFLLIKYVFHDKNIKFWDGLSYPFIGRVDKKIVNKLITIINWREK